MMRREFSDEFQLDISTAGTTVSLAKALQSPISVEGDAPWKAARPPDGLEVDVALTPDGVVISLTGSLDSSTIDRLQSSLLDIERHGPLPLTLVLDELILLASAGLRTLYEYAGRPLGGRRPLRLVASAGSPARDVLAVSGLDQLVDVDP